MQNCENECFEGTDASGFEKRGRQIAQVPLGEKIRKSLCHEKMYVEDSAAIKSVYTKLVVFYMQVEKHHEAITVSFKL